MKTTTDDADQILPIIDDDESFSAMASRSWFARFAKMTARRTGHPVAFGIAGATVIIWALTGPIFDYSDTWQLVINTGTTVVTFLMVFLIQNSQNRDSVALQIKVDELIRATQGAHNALLDLEELEEEQLVRINRHYERLAAQAREALARGGYDTGVPAVPVPQEAAAMGDARGPEP